MALLDSRKRQVAQGGNGTPFIRSLTIAAMLLHRCEQDPPIFLPPGAVKTPLARKTPLAAQCRKGCFFLRAPAFLFSAISPNGTPMRRMQPGEMPAKKRRCGRSLPRRPSALLSLCPQQVGSRPRSAGPAGVFFDLRLHYVRGRRCLYEKAKQTRNGCAAACRSGAVHDRFFLRSDRSPGKLYRLSRRSPGKAGSGCG